MEKGPDAFRTISELADELDLPQHVLRFWETRFSQIRPMKRSGGRRYYRPEDVELVRAIKTLLYGQGYTIKGVQKLFKDNGVRAVVGAARTGRPLGPVQEALAFAEAPPEPAAVPATQEAETGEAAPGAEALADLMAQFPAERLREIVAELAECARILRAARA
ncbi:MAG: MerR family transcriptional regulator [Beijerinckiaceae bacterium]